MSKERRPYDTILELSDGRIISAHFQPLHSRGWVVTHEDITDRRAAEAKISFLARHDVLTGLANRALFQDRLALAVAQAKRGSGFAVLFLDLDRFKAVNDTFGHAVGDSLLRAVAGRIQEAVRDGDTVARLGGDEFAILQVNVCDPNETDIVARRIVQTLCAPFELDRHRVSIGVSIGIAMAPRDGFDPDRLMKDADRALYRSKHEGRGTWRFFETTLDEVHETVC